MKSKVYFVKRKVIIWILTIMVLAFTSVDIMVRNHLTKSVFAIPLSEKTIVIDPGHGGIDAGASDNNVVEKDINLAVSKYLQEYIESGGGTAILTRVDDANTADPNRGKGLSQKMSDLKERKKDIDDFDADAFISIHMNKFGQAKYRGTQVFYDEKSGESKIFAELIQQSVKDVLKDNNNRKAKPTGQNIYILRDNVVTSALIECGFLSNAEEARLLATPEYQKKIAWGIYVGIIRYFSR